MLRVIVEVLKKDLRQARRDPRFFAPSLIISLVFLLVFAILWGYIGGGGESFACGLVVQDQSPEAEDMALIIENMQSTTNYTWFKITRYDLETARRLYSGTDIVSYILIPTGFGENVTDGVKAKITIFIVNSNDDIVKNYVHRIETAVLLFNQGAAYPEFDQSGARIALDETLTLPMTVSNLGYMASLSILLSAMTCALAGQGLTTATEFENGAIHEMLCSPSSRLGIVIGRNLSALPRSFAVLLISAPVIYFFYWQEMSMNGDPLLLVGVLAIGVLTLASVGELIGIAVKKRETALLVSVLFSIVAFLAGGGIAPIGLLPAEFRVLLWVLPTSHIIHVWNRVFFLNTTTGLTLHLSVLVVMWLIVTLVAVKLMDREAKHL